MPVGTVDIANLVLRFSVEIGEIKKGITEVKNEVKDLSAKTVEGSDRMIAAVRKAKTAYLEFMAKVYLVYQLIRKGVELTWIGAEAEQVGQSFSIMTKSLGVDGDVLIRKMSEVGRVFVEQTNLMLKAQRLLAEGVEAADIVGLMEAAVVASKIAGGTIEQWFDRIAEAVIGRMPRGIKAAFPMELNRVMKDYAESLGRVKEDLSEIGERQAMINEILRQAKDKKVTLGDAFGPSAYESLQKVRSALSQIWEDLSKIILGLREPIFKTGPVDWLLKPTQLLSMTIGVIRTHLEVLGLIAKTTPIARPLPGEEWKTEVRYPLEFITRKKVAGVPEAEESRRAWVRYYQEQRDKRIDWDKVQEKLDQQRLAAEIKMVAARSAIRLVGLEKDKAIALAEASRTMEDVSYIEQEWNIKIARQTYQSTLESLEAQRLAARWSAEKKGEDLRLVEAEFALERKKAATELEKTLSEITAKRVQARAEAERKSIQEMYGAEYAVATILQRAEMDLRSRNISLREEEYKITRQMVESQIDERELRIGREESLRREIGLQNELLESYRKQFEELGVGSEGYAELRSKIDGVVDRIRELNFQLEEQTANILELAERGMKEFAAAAEQEVIFTFKDILPANIRAFGDEFRNLLKTGEFDFQSFADSLIDIWANVIQRMIEMWITNFLVQTLGGGGFGRFFGFLGLGGGGGAVPYAGPIAPSGLPWAQKGGAFWAERPTVFGVGEGGEPELVSITPKSKLAAAGAGGEKGTTIVNFVDPKLMSQYLASAEGRSAFVNVIRAEAGVIKRALR